MSRQHTHKERYGEWAGCPKGYAPDPKKCAAEVCSGYLFHQCSRALGHGPNGVYCKQHAKRYQEVQHEQAE